jgi:hypothetical protein
MKPGELLSFENGDGESGTGECAGHDRAGRSPSDYDDIAM